MSIRTKLEEREYTSVSAFSADMAHVFTSEIGVQPAGDTAELQMQISGRAPELSLEQREKRKLAKRIIKAIQPALEDAIKKESDLSRKPFENELKELDSILESSVLSRGASVGAPAASTAADTVPNGAEEEKAGLAEATSAKPESIQGSNATALVEKTSDPVVPEADATEAIESAAKHEQSPTAEPLAVSGAESEAANAPPTTTIAPTTETEKPESGEVKKDTDSISLQPQRDPLTPPLSFQGDQQLPLAQGGIQWYMEPFDPVGTTIHEERWTGRDVMRGMSEELSELDDEELEGLMDGEDLEGETAAVSNGVPTAPRPEAPVIEQPVKVHRTRRRWRGFK